jgi:hypothetical protein
MASVLLMRRSTIRVGLQCIQSGSRKLPLTEGNAVNLHSVGAVPFARAAGGGGIWILSQKT